MRATESNLPDDAPADEASSNAEEVYRSHGSWLYRFFRRRFGPQDAQDLTQETFVRVVGANIEIRDPRAFLTRVALNTVRDQSRRAAVRPILVSDETSLQDAATPADLEHQLLLEQIVLTLPPRLREVFFLSRFVGLTYVEIAHRCGISVKTVEARMTKALAICTALMD
ncbi:RNA polymerase sigma factor [Phenylobacterium sp.]|uniref:RNA polymerase sigma factor n=1 Tax=Phenylobacterium sp. TaxID=1871053 RepID=UPI0035622DB5